MNIRRQWWRKSGDGVMGGSEDGQAGGVW